MFLKNGCGRYKVRVIVSVRSRAAAKETQLRVQLVRVGDTDTVMRT